MVKIRMADLEAPLLSRFAAEELALAEREVLAAIRDRGLPLPDEAQKTIYEGDEPIATADFFYEPKIPVFVDGSPHYRDYIAAADERKRRRLKAKGYRIVAIKDIEAGLDELATKLGALERWTFPLWGMGGPIRMEEV